MALPAADTGPEERSTFIPTPAVNSAGGEEKRAMNSEKIRNLTDAELAHQKTELSEELFKLKFQLKMGQTESLKKMRGLKKDIARVLTIQREKQLAATKTGTEKK
jgi:large subunit ribosomal protein L29